MKLVLYKFKKNLEFPQHMRWSSLWHQPSVAHRQLTSLVVHPKYHGGPRYASELIFLKILKADFKFLKTKRKTFTQNAKVRTCKIILYRLSFRIFSIISFDLHSSLAIVTGIVFIACLYLLKSFFNFETDVLHQAIFP